MQTNTLRIAGVLALLAGCTSENTNGQVSGDTGIADAQVDNVDSGSASADTSQRCATIAESVTNAGFNASVDVTCDEAHAFVRSDTFPNHEMMTGIVGTNEQVPVPAIDYVTPIPLVPTPAATLTTRDAALGVAVNGVPMYDYTAGGELSQADLSIYQDRLDTITTGQLDNCGGHAGRGDDYHYHARPNCMIDQMANAGDDAILGWAFDGYPIYGNNNPDGTTIGEDTLGTCNEQVDDRFGVRYHTSDSWPYTLQCLVGEVGTDPNALPRVPPLRGVSGGDRPSGTPPQGGVEGLTFTAEGEARIMRYRYQGDDYYISYRPTENPNCYEFETRTVTDRGVVQNGEYCR